MSSLIAVGFEEEGLEELCHGRRGHVTKNFDCSDVNEVEESEDTCPSFELTHANGTLKREIKN